MMGTKEWTYKTTHPWITFELDPASFTHELWVLLGECQSKCEHVAGVPLKPETAEELNKIYLAKGIQATTAIEGNTLTEVQVRAQIEGRLKTTKSEAYLAQEVANVHAAMEEMLKNVFDGSRTELSVDSILRYNELVLQSLTLHKGVVPGKLRKHAVAVGMYRGVPYEECEHLLKTMCDWLNGLRVLVDAPLLNAIVKAILAHLYTVWIHPFGEGNGRTARLLEVELLLAAGVPAPSAHLLSNHFNQTRQAYYIALDDTSISGGDVVPFLTYAVQGFRDQLQQQIDVIRQQHIEVTWTNFIYEFFGSLISEASIRRRNLLLDMPESPTPRLWKELKRTSPRVAESYANKTDRTLERDVDFLLENELLHFDLNGYQPNKNLVKAFLPKRVEE